MLISPADFLTLIRLVLVPWVLFYFVKAELATALVLFLIAGTTDLIDGTIARLTHRQTRFGAIFDPIADKALMGVTFACLWVAGIVPLWFFALVVVRDLMILGGLGWLKWKKIVVELKPVVTSKYATLCQLTTAVFGFLYFLYPEEVWFWPLSGYLNFFMILSAILILSSGVYYFNKGMRILNAIR